MSDDDEFEELPVIFVNSSVSNTSTFSMPSAETLATQRARELECERELKLLREHHATDDATPVPRCDSSGSETEASLAAAVTDLHVAAPEASTHRHCAARLLPALASCLPASSRPLLEQPDIALRLPELVASIGAMVSADEVAWSDDDVWAVGALLTAAVLANDAITRVPAARALHTLLDYRATQDQVESFGRILGDALPAVRARLELSDALRSGAAAGADHLAAALRDRALLELLGEAPDAEQGNSEPSVECLARALREAWRRLDPASGYNGVQLLGRRLGVEDREARGRLLAALAPPLAAPHEAQRPDRLKVLVGIDKLRLLFHSDK